MLSPTGQILAPSSCPPWLLVNFITENMEQAKKMITDYHRLVILPTFIDVLCYHS